MALGRGTTWIRIAAAAVVAVAALTGCSGGDDPVEPDDEVSPTAETTGDTACVTGTWDLDLTDLASQMAIELASDGLEVIEYAGVGRHTFTFRESGEASESVDATFTLTATSGAGPEITVVQIHTGEPFGFWDWRDNSSVMTFFEWEDGGYEVQNITAIDGVPTEGTIALPGVPLGGTDLEIVCDGSSLSTHSPSSPYTQHWSAAP
jgi:hypothetical protein